MVFEEAALSPWRMQLPLVKPASDRDSDYCHPAALSCMALNSWRMKAWKMYEASVIASLVFVVQGLCLLSSSYSGDAWKANRGKLVQIKQQQQQK